MNNTWLLFDNGSPCSIDCVIYPMPPNRSKKADAYVIPDIGGDLSVAAVNAAAATYDCLKNRKKNLPEFIAGIRLLERTDDRTNIEGESGGLIFSIAIAIGLLKLKMPDIAATGIVRADGVVNAVGGLDSKLKTAAEKIGRNGYIFYPEKNKIDIPHDTTAVLEKKQVKCVAVSHISEVFDMLFPVKTPIVNSLPRNKTPGKISVPAVFLFLLTLIGLVSFGIYSLQTHWPDKQKTEITHTVPESSITAAIPKKPAAQPPIPKPVKKPAALSPIEDKGFE